MPNTRGPAHAALRSLPERYHLTLSCPRRRYPFGVVRQERFLPSAVGQIVEQTIAEVPGWYEGFAWLETQLMPNHLHLVADFRSTVARPPELIRRLKSLTTVRVRDERLLGSGRLWHRNYWDRVLWTQPDVDRVVAYVRDNPRRWWVARGG